MTISVFRPFRAPALAALLLVGAIALPATASSATPEEVASCQTTISALNRDLTATDPLTDTFTNFTSLSVKDRTGLSGKLTEASQKLGQGKYRDALDKLVDFRARVGELQAAGKITTADATGLLTGVDAAIACVNGLLASTTSV